MRPRDFQRDAVITSFASLGGRLPEKPQMITHRPLLPVRLTFWLPIAPILNLVLHISQSQPR